MEDCLLEVKRGRGIWLAPEPLARWAGDFSGVRWLPVTDAGTFQMAVVWPPYAPAELVVALADQARLLGTR